MSCKLIACTHRHCIFTIPEELRDFFLKDRGLLNGLFHSVRDAILRMFHKINKSENFTPGFICVLHTFARNLKKHEDGFYVRAKPNLCSPDITVKYITRYLGRPVIATSRIDVHDGEYVTFHYTPHDEDRIVTERIPALYFIKKLIVHIPEKHFKMLRYYGIYVKRHPQSSDSTVPKTKKHISNVMAK